MTSAYQDMYINPTAIKTQGIFWKRRQKEFKNLKDRKYHKILSSRHAWLAHSQTHNRWVAYMRAA